MTRQGEQAKDKKEIKSNQNQLVGIAETNLTKLFFFRNLFFLFVAYVNIVSPSVPMFIER